ncbi:MAG: site-specific integrase [Limnoraphis sp.]
MKIDRHGRAKILTQDEIYSLFNQGFIRDKHKALFAICLYTACRIGEAVSLKTNDIYDRYGRMRSELNIRKEQTKGKLATRTIPIVDDLKRYLEIYKRPKHEYLFPARQNNKTVGHIKTTSAGAILAEACDRIKLVGVSSHSFRRTALTQMSNAGIPLRVIQEISGHRTLDELYKYLEVKPEQIRGAVASLSMLSPVERVEEEVSSEKPLLDPADPFINFKF